MDNMEPIEKKLPFVNETRKELINRFFSILITAILSALIAFLQSLIVEPATGVPPQDQVTTAGTVGATIRSVMEYAKFKKYN